jgi:hypothetical protein
MTREDPEGTRKQIRTFLYELAGDMTKTAERLGVSRLMLHRCMNRLGMRGEAEKYRARGYLRFRLPIPRRARHNEIANGG